VRQILCMSDEEKIQFELARRGPDILERIGKFEKKKTGEYAQVLEIVAVSRHLMRPVAVFQKEKHQKILVQIFGKKLLEDKSSRPGKMICVLRRDDKQHYELVKL